MTSAWIPLHRLLAAGRPAKTTVARRLDGAYLWSDLEGHVAGLCDQLAGQPKGRWLLACESSYAFGVGLLALWQTGRVVVLPPNAQPESLRESAHGARGMISDGATLSGKPVLAPLATIKKASGWKTLHPKRAALELFTSGSTGARKTVRKTLVQLESELSVLEKTFGRRMGSGPVYATVSHQHIYGLLFRLLWPLSAGRAFTDSTFLLWDELLSRLPARAACLVASPAHLERMTPEFERVLRKKSPRVLFSSGGPLRQAAAGRLRPVEVFGSTETGGIGWRVRATEDAAWIPFEGVTVSVHSSTSGRLRVKSRFGPSPAWMLTGDRGRVAADGGFYLEGRTDRIVKIEEKRLSLDDMERRLKQHPDVAAARVVVLEPRARDEGRTCLGAAVVLKRARDAAALREHLKKSFDAATLPRAFRFVDALPFDAMGKVSRPALLALFRPGFDPAVTTPQSLKKEKAFARLSHRVRVPETLAYLQGHFPDHPIVPGVVQLQWVIDEATAWLGKRPVVRRMDAVKFKTPLLPGREFSIVLERAVSGSEPLLRFSLMDGETLFSSGRLVLA